MNEWEEFQKRAKKKDRSEGNLIGVNIFVTNEVGVNFKTETKDEVIKKIKKHEEALDIYFKSQSTITHLDKCEWDLNINEKNKVITLVCDNQTEFAKSFNNKAKIINLQDDWKLNILMFHAKNNLVCLGFCKICTSESEEGFLCPRCGSLSKVPTALSRRDNKTKICSNCGTAEAIFDVQMYQWEDEKEKGILIEKEKKWLNRNQKGG